MPIIIVSILIQIALVIHVVKTGRNTTWIWIVVTLPLAGSIGYLILEVLPDIFGTRGARQAGRKVKSAINPNKDINDATKQFARSDTVENSMRLAEECYNKGLYSDAKELYSKCLQGPLFDDPHLIFGLAKSDFELGNFTEVESSLDRLIELNPEYKNPEAHLLYARTLDKLNKVAGALHEYETLHRYFAGPAASFYFAHFLKKQNQQDKSMAIFQQIVNAAANSGKHYNAIHQEFIKGAKDEVSG